MIVDRTAVIDEDVLSERNHGSFLSFHEAIVYLLGILLRGVRTLFRFL